MEKKPEILHKTILAETRCFQIEGLHLRFSNGEERHYERVGGRSPGSVMILPMLDAETILLVREYGAGIDEYVLHFPKGAMHTGEDLLLTANRELMEEVGYGANKLELIAKFCASPGYNSTLMYVVLAQDLYEKRIEGDEPEPIEVIPWKLSKVTELLIHPQFYEARSVAALLMLERQRYVK